VSSRPTESTLTKAVIYVLDRDFEPIEDGEIPVLFNPAEYNLEKSVTYGEQSIPGLSSPVIQFVNGGVETLSMELFFDTYEEGTAVTEHTKKLDTLLAVDGDLHAPHACRFVWGDEGGINFKSVLESASKAFTMFLQDGTPVRATANVTFKRLQTPREQGAEQPSSSPDKTKLYIVREGDTLWGIAAAEYGDPTAWRPIANENDIENPRSLQVGHELVVPPLER
jgi:hypothetical protein